MQVSERTKLRGSRKLAVSATLSIVALTSAGLLLGAFVHYLMVRRLGFDWRFSLVVSFFLVAVWVALSLSSFWYLLPRFLLGGETNHTPWFVCALLLFLLFLLGSRFLVSLPWRIAALLSGFISVTWLLALHFGDAARASR